jgi:hypothetical protein
VRVSGHILRSRYVYAKSRGPEAYAQILEALPEDLREILDAGFLETRWYPYEILVDLTETMDRVLGTGDMSIAYDMGRFSCDQNLTTVMRLLFKFGNIGWLLDRVAKAWGTQFDEGHMQVVRRDVGEEVVLELHDHPAPNRAHCLGIKGWMVRATELSGEDTLECIEECRAAGDDVCRWSFRWP